MHLETFSQDFSGSSFLIRVNPSWFIIISLKLVKILTVSWEMARTCKICLSWRNGLELYLIAEKLLWQLKLTTKIPAAPSVFSYSTIRLWALNFCAVIIIITNLYGAVSISKMIWKWPVIVDEYKINTERSPKISNIVENQVLVYNDAERLLQYSALFENQSILYERISRSYMCERISRSYMSSLIRRKTNYEILHNVTNHIKERDPTL